jgi:glutathione S-transferase
MKLYTTALSPFSAKVRAALYEKGVAFEATELAWKPTGFLAKPPAMLAINPRGEVPVLVDGELGLYDSTVILEYLEDRYPQPPLAPREPAARAVCRQLEDLGDELTGGASAQLVDELWRKPADEARDAALIKEGHEGMQRAYARLEQQLGREQWLCGAFSVADISCYVPVSFAGFVGHGPDDTHPRVRDWLARAGERPSIARVRQEMLDAVKALAG